MRVLWSVGFCMCVALNLHAQIYGEPVYPNHDVSVLCHGDVKEHCVTPPKAIKRPEPDYTTEAKNAKIEGAVLLSVVIDKTGKIYDATVIKKLGYGLDERAMDTVAEWEFEPATYEGKPVRCRVYIEITFHLLKDDAKQGSSHSPNP
jgi:TonB family protein